MKKTDKLAIQENKNNEIKRQYKHMHDLRIAQKDAYENGDLDSLAKLQGELTNSYKAYNESIEKKECESLETMILDIARDKKLMDKEKINLTEELKNIDIDTLKVSDLKAICKTFGLTMTGKKEELKNRINEYIYQHTDKHINSINDVFENIYKNGYFDNIVRMIIRKCGKSNTTIADTCNNIVFNNYNDVLYEDIKQSIAESLFSMIKKDLAKWDIEKGSFVYRELIKDENGSIAGYGNYVTDNTRKQTSFLHLFATTRKCIESYSKNSRHSEKDIEQNNGFNSMDMLTALESKENVILFMEYLKNEDSKNYSLYCAIIQGIFEDVKQTDIADSLSINVRKVKYLTSKLYDYAKVFFQCSGSVSIHNIEYIKIKEGGSVILKKDGNIYKESLTGKVINLDDSSKYHSTDKKGVIMYNVKYRIS